VVSKLLGDCNGKKEMAQNQLHDDLGLSTNVMK
jgi:hypothetical protein